MIEYIFQIRKLTCDKWSTTYLWLRVALRQDRVQAHALHIAYSKGSVHLSVKMHRFLLVF